MIDPALERPKAPDGAETNDAVTISFGDLKTNTFGIARVGRSLKADGSVDVGGMGLLFADGDVIEVRAQAGVAPTGDEWGDAVAGGVRTTVVEPFRSWTVKFEGDDATLGFDLKLRALSAPAMVRDDDPVASLVNGLGWEQLVSVEGTVRAGGAARQVACLGQRGRSWGVPDWSRLGLTRTVGVWLETGDGIAVTAARKARKSDHGSEAISGTIWTSDDDMPASALAAAVRIEEPRLSTTYDDEGRQRAAGLELYVQSDGPAHRAAGEVLCGTTLDLGELRLDTCFLHWHMEGAEGVGRYDLLRKVES